MVNHLMGRAHVSVSRALTGYELHRRAFAVVGGVLLAFTSNMACLTTAMIGSEFDGGSSDDGGNEDAGAQDAGADAGPVDAGTVLVIGEVTDDNTGRVLDSYKICIQEDSSAPSCLQVDGGSDAGYALNIPVVPVDAGSFLPIAWIATSPGYLGSTINASEGPFTAVALPFTDEELVLTPDVEAASWADAAGFDYPDGGGGFIAIYVGDEAGDFFAGATATLNSPAGRGPVYGDLNGPIRTLTATSIAGSIFFGNVMPGAFSVTIDAPGRNCLNQVTNNAVYWLWPPFVENEVHGLVTEGALTSVLLEPCK